MMNVSRSLRLLRRSIARNSSALLSGLAVISLFASVISSIAATPRAIDLIEDELDKRWEELKEAKKNELIAEFTKRDIIKLTWREYIPSMFFAIVTVISIIGAHRISFRRYAAVVSALGVASDRFRAYTAKVMEVYGPKEELKIRDKISSDTLKENSTSNAQIYITGRGKTLCFDTWSGRYFENNIETMNRAVNELNRNMMNEHFISLNELYYDLGLTPVKNGDIFGFHIDDGLIDLNYSSQIADNDEPCIVINLNVKARYR